MSLASGLLMAMERYIKQRTPTWVLGARPAAQATGARTMTIIRAGEAVSDGGKVYTVRAYTSDQLGAQGGPGLDDWLVAMKMPGAGKFLAFGHLAVDGDPANDFCPLVLVCRPPLGMPVGNIGLGPWASKTVAPDGYSVSDGGMLNPYAHLVMTLDENDKADAIFITARAADGTLTYPYNLIPDWSITDAAGDKPVMSELMTGSLQALGGIVGLVTDGHDPTDADVVGSAVTSGHVGIDGTTAVRHDFSHSRHFTRMGNAWIPQANLIFFSGVDSTGLTYSPAVGDLGFGTDSSLWLCTAATAAPGTWQKIYPPSSDVIGAFVWTANTPSIWAEADTTPVKVVFDQGTDTTGGSIWTASADHFTIPSDGYYSFGYNVTVATNDFTGDGNPFRPRIGMRIDPMVTIDQPDIEDQIDYGTTTVTDYPQRFYHFNSSREAYFHAGDIVILYTSGGDGGGETGYLPNGGLLFNHSAWIRKIG